MSLSSTHLLAEEPSRAEFAEIRDRIDRRLSQLLPEVANGESLAQAMRTSVLSSGKRVRPTLLILAGQGLGSESPALLDLGCAVEMVHTASLILDDMPCMDNASLRRGQPTTHRQFGEDVAMLAAVALLSRAFGLIATIEALPPDQRTQLVVRLSECVGMQGLAKGQYLDLHEGVQPRSVDAVMASNDLKTGVLFETAIAMAAIVAAAPGPVAEGPLGAEEAQRRLAEHLWKTERCLTEVYGNERLINLYVQKLFARLRP
ncbi:MULTISPECIES: polyprenyl synthetase family protein [Halomonadaceae]|uniref:polyprenyl synthetase family protein n=1 Tax=Halomonadaceae TaxID=28256 RepID=UPI001599600A|nr:MULTISPECIES: polyprenyl synthetase family protein [Halomonas]QJQ96345.1 polyprenyl synthetase family protein [Halomonas sp. PA5]